MLFKIVNSMFGNQRIADQRHSDDRHLVAVDMRHNTCSRGHRNDGDMVVVARWRRLLLQHDV